MTKDEVLTHTGDEIARRGLRAVCRLFWVLRQKYGEERAHTLLSATCSEIKVRKLSGMAAVAFVQAKTAQYTKEV